jgi:hypothetical protein
MPNPAAGFPCVDRYGCGSVSGCRGKRLTLPSGEYVTECEFGACPGFRNVHLVWIEQQGTGAPTRWPHIEGRRAT